MISFVISLILGISLGLSLLFILWMIYEAGKDSAKLNALEREISEREFELYHTHQFKLSCEGCGFLLLLGKGETAIIEDIFEQGQKKKR